MTDLEIAKLNLRGHTLALCKNGEVIISDKRGVAPMADFIESGVDLRGYSAADKVVGKAAAALFVKAGVIKVFAETLSQGGKDMLKKYGVLYEYVTLTDRIINRQGTDVCPMEKAVARCAEAEECYLAIADELKKLRS